MTRVLFVCTGNICRSPTAEGVFRTLVERAGLAREISCDSASTHDYHVGDPPDLRTQAAARSRGYELMDLRARKVAREDFFEYDLVLAMDDDNMAALSQMQPKGARTLPALFLEYVGNPGMREVADPYYGGAQGFDEVLGVIESAAAQLLAALAASCK